MIATELLARRESFRFDPALHPHPMGGTAPDWRSLAARAVRAGRHGYLTLARAPISAVALRRSAGPSLPAAGWWALATGLVRAARPALSPSPEASSIQLEPVCLAAACGGGAADNRAERRRQRLAAGLVAVAALAGPGWEAVAGLAVASAALAAGTGYRLARVRLQAEKAVRRTWSEGGPARAPLPIAVSEARAQAASALAAEQRRDR